MALGFAVSRSLTLPCLSRPSLRIPRALPGRRSRTTIRTESPPRALEQRGSMSDPVNPLGPTPDGGPAASGGPGAPPHKPDADSHHPTLVLRPRPDGAPVTGRPELPPDVP